MTEQDPTTSAVATWVNDLRTALGLSRLAFGGLLADRGVPRTAAYRFEVHGRATADELATVAQIMRDVVADAERRVAAARKALAVAVPAATVALVPAAEKPEKKVPAKAPAKKAAAKKEIEAAPALDDMSLADLRALAAARGWSTLAKATKATILKTLREHPDGPPAVAKARAKTTAATPKRAEQKATVQREIDAVLAQSAPPKETGTSAKATPAARRSTRRTTTARVR